ncbi:MAG: CBS domain-containing protein [Bacteroidota bacterium]|nr:CBS domain-containing protein [Bacteroidota bacterium]
MKISASIYSSKESEREGLIKMFDEHNIDSFHVDCNDDIGVFDDIKEIRKLSSTPFDLHIISSEPEKFYPLIAKYNIEYVTFQYEELKNSIDIPDYVKAECGLAIVTETDISVFDKYHDKFSHILFMATTPGKSGGSFNKENFQKISRFKQKYPKKKIHIDGGVNAELSFIFRNVGVNLIVVGSYLFKSNYIGASLLNLKSDNIKSHYLVKDFMKKTNLPLMIDSGNSFLDVLKAIEKYNLGFIIITNSDNKMLGIITNADIRRGMIKYFDEIDKVTIKDIINSNPVFIYENKTVSDLLQLANSINFPLLYLPVTDKNKKVVGTLSFNKLIQSEL